MPDTRSCRGAARPARAANCGRQGAEAGMSIPHGPSAQRHCRGLAARRLLRRRHGRRFDLVRHARHRQHRPPGLHHPRLLHRLHRQRDVRHRSDPRRASSCCRRSTCSARPSIRSTTCRSSGAARKRCAASRSSSACCSSPRSSLILVFGVDYRYVEAPYIGPTWRIGFVDLPLRMLVPVPGLAAHGARRCSCSCRAPSSAAPSWPWRRTSWRCG